MGDRGPEVSIAKPPGTYRVVLLGGSTTHGYGVDNHDTIDAHMRDILQERFPERQFEVVNLAFGGYDSYQVYERLRVDALPLQPDLVVINSGINDVRNSVFSALTVPDKRTLSWEANFEVQRREAAEGGPSLWTRFTHHSYLARLPSYFRYRLRIPGVVQRNQTTLPKPSAIEYFATNIRGAAELALQAGANVILSTPASSLPTRYEPTDTSTRGYWVIDAATTEAYRERLGDRMRKIAESLGPEGAVPYVQFNLPPNLFLDDCHLTTEGNRRVASTWVDVLTQSLPEFRSQQLRASN
jgi:lysophospholipase L1-like esterase